VTFHLAKKESGFFMRIKKGAAKRLWIAVLIVVVCVLGGLAGYYIAGYLNQKPAVQQPHQADENSNQPRQEQSQLEQENPSQQQSQEVLSEVYKAVARFVGGVDAHTIQLSLINTNFDFKEFEVDENLTQGLNLSEGEIVEVEFEKPKDGGNPRIVSIKKPDKVTLKGKFVGLADNNFAEFVFDQKHIVLQISNVSDKLAYLNENTDVEVTFKTNPQSPKSNPVVEDIKALE